MTHEYARRDVLSGIGTGALTLFAVGPVAAGGNARYLAATRGRRGPDRIESAGFRVQGSLADGGVHLVVGPAGRLDDLERVRGVAHAARDLQFRLDSPAASATDASTDGHLGLPHIDPSLHPFQWDKDLTSVPDAHEVATGAGTSVAIIDTGVGVTHPNLAGNLDVPNGRRVRSFAVGSPLSAGEMAADPVRGGTGDVEVPSNRDDLTEGTTVLEDELVNDVDGHGTNVAGIAAADPDVPVGLGVTGTAPDATVLPLRVFYWLEVPAEGGGTVAELFTTTGDILTAIEYAAGAGVDAMNLSIGTPPIPPQDNSERFRPIYQTVIQSAVRRGSVVVVSAGNSAADLQSGLFTVPNSVAGAMSISATAPNDELTFYSNFGTNELDVGAPGGGYETLDKTLCTAAGVVDGSCAEGECVECDPPAWPFPNNLVFNAYMADGSGDGLLETPAYAFLAGTSMAAPQVTGAAALARQVSPRANAKQVEQAIEQGADLVRGKGSPELGAGRLNASATLDAPSL